ncbi:TPA: hypothetical protein ACH3X1_000290 [Trebouxia sp. C0004]
MSASCVLSPSVPAAESGRHTPQICRFKTLQVFSRVRIRQGIRFQAPPTKRCACFSCNTAQKEDIGKVKAWTHQTRGCIGTIPPGVRPQETCVSDILLVYHLLGRGCKHHRMTVHYSMSNASNFNVYWQCCVHW